MYITSGDECCCCCCCNLLVRFLFLSCDHLIHNSCIIVIICNKKKLKNQITIYLPSSSSSLYFLFRFILCLFAAISARNVFICNIFNLFASLSLISAATLYDIFLCGNELWVWYFYLYMNAEMTRTRVVHSKCTRTRVVHSKCTRTRVVHQFTRVRKHQPLFNTVSHVAR